jgi:hypothetical protein
MTGKDVSKFTRQRWGVLCRGYDMQSRQLKLITEG